MSDQAQDLLKSGDLAGALSALQDAVRKDPASAKLRIFLFQLLCVMGQWERALAQVKLSAEMEPAAIPMAQAYREAIICEVYRSKIFSGEKTPVVFGEPQEWTARIVEAQSALAEGKINAAAALRNEAFDAAPAASGTVNGEPFKWVADADNRLGPLLEIIINGRYFWMPFTAISKAQFEEPADLRDAVWTPAQITLANGGDVVALVPTRYADTVPDGTDAEKLARATNWHDAGGDYFFGRGQRVLATDKGDVALMELRELVMDAGDG